MRSGRVPPPPKKTQSPINRLLRSGPRRLRRFWSRSLPGWLTLAVGDPLGRRDGGYPLPLFGHKVLETKYLGPDLICEARIQPAVPVEVCARVSPPNHGYDSAGNVLLESFRSGPIAGQARRCGSSSGACLIIQVLSSRAYRARAGSRSHRPKVVK